MKQVLILLGKARSGKDTVADFLVKEFGFKKFVFSSVLEEELIKQGKEVSKKSMALLGDELRKEFGMGVIAQKLLEKQTFEKSLNKKEEEKIVFVGARSTEEIELIKQRFSEAKLVLIKAEENERFERRSELDPDELEEFSFRDKLDEEKKGMKNVFLLAEFKIDNNGSLNDLFEKTRDLMGNLFK